MRMDAVLSQLYNPKSAAIGAAPKKEEKPKDTYAKMIGDIWVAKYQVRLYYIYY